MRLALTTRAELNEAEAANILRAVLRTRRSRAARTDLLNPKTLTDLHRWMFDGTWHWAGRFRKTGKSIGVEAWRIGVELRNLVEDVQTWIDSETYPPEEVLARFHHRLVWIHPFPNGNGRHARLATDLLAGSRGWAVPTWGRTDLAHAGETRTRYIASLRAADAHDFAPLLAFLWS